MGAVISDHRKGPTAQHVQLERCGSPMGLDLSMFPELHDGCVVCAGLVKFLKQREAYSKNMGGWEVS